MTKYEKPNLRNPDGSKFEIIGKSETWVRLSQQTHKVKIQFLVTKKLQSVFILGLQDLRKLHFIPHANLEKWIDQFKEEAEKVEVVNNVDNEDSETEEDGEEK